MALQGNGMVAISKMDVVYYLSFPFQVNLICSKTMRSAQVSDYGFGGFNRLSDYAFNRSVINLT